jgi:hypothetical protein
VSARDGRLKAVTPEQTPRRRPPRLQVSIEALATIAAGALSPVRAAEIGLVTSTGGAAEIMEPWFRTRPVFLYQMNAF